MSPSHEDTLQRMVPRQRLPNELLVQVFSYLKFRHETNPWRDRCTPTLRSITLASRCFYDLATPFLYYRFQVLEDGQFINRESLFLRTIFENPHLGDYVRVVKLGVSSQWHGLPLSDEELEVFSRIARILMLDLDKTFWTMLTSTLGYSSVSLTVMLLHFLPKLEELYFELVDDQFPKHLLPKPDGALLGNILTNLQKLRIEFVSSHTDMVNVWIAPWLRLPSITIFEAVSFSIDYDLILDASNLTSIDLNGAMSSFALDNILGNCENLKSFRYQFDPNIYQEDDTPAPDEVLDGLRRLASKSLESLKLRYYSSGEYSDNNQWELSIALSYDFSLCCFEKLKYLEIDAPFIVGTDQHYKELHEGISSKEVPRLLEVLPPRITELRLHACGMYTQEQIGDLARGRIVRPMYPSLKLVEINSFKQFFFTRSFLKDVRKKFLATDVQFKYDYSEEYPFDGGYEGDLTMARNDFTSHEPTSLFFSDSDSDDSD
ncbi:hypothetical protein BU16DRAFT_223669 [Lophium mytilinum]|uniref:F-box domain-containing protein n=1 Tax=Lophium mytilinum TaxID=390894 RepID=A0A6A6Q830_9PEZI|nr:hypothetical protein BU16DRAFT_223669 [Lophium mytilinum]